MAFADGAGATASTAKGRKKGAEVKAEKLLPSQTFDWAKARRLHAQTVLEIYGPTGEGDPDVD